MPYIPDAGNLYIFIEFNLYLEKNMRRWVKETETKIDSDKILE